MSDHTKTDAADERRMVSRARKARYLSREEEHELFRRWRRENDPRALDRIIESYTRLVLRHARFYQRANIDLQDLVQEGHIGLLSAARRFDPESFSNSFGTFATHYVRAAMLEFVRRNSSPVKLEATSAGRLLSLHLSRLEQDARRELGLDGCSDPNQDELASHIAGKVGVASDVVSAFMAIRSSSFSLDDDGIPEAQQFTDLPESHEDSVINRIDAERFVDGVLPKLNSRQRDILTRRHLQPDEDPATLRDLAKDYGISHERVRQIEAEMLETLRKKAVGLRWSVKQEAFERTLEYA